MILKEFCFEHLELFEWREDDKNAYDVGSELLRAIGKAEESGTCFTLVHDGRIMVIGGIVQLSEKTGYGFTIWSRFSDNHKISCSRYVRRQFERMAEAMGLHRITTWNRIGTAAHRKWCEWLGFQFECIVKKFDDEGNDYEQYAWVKHGN